MKAKKIIYVVYPKSLETVSMNTLSMTELLLNELVLSKINSINFHVDNRLRLIECNDPKVKNILDLLLKSGKLFFVKDQIIELIHKEDDSDGVLGRLKFLIDNKKIDLIIREVNSGCDFSWRVSRIDN